jgi:hypothetical protein
MRWAGHIAWKWNMKNAYKFLVGKPDEICVHT